MLNRKLESGKLFDYNKEIIMPCSLIILHLIGYPHECHNKYSRKNSNLLFTRLSDSHSLYVAVQYKDMSRWFK